MITTALRNASVADVIRGLQTSTDVIALGWGMGDVQNCIPAAVDRGARMGLLTTATDRNGNLYVELTPYGREWTPQPVFTLSYRTSNDRRERVLPAAGVERVGAVVMRLADRDMATDIEVHDEDGVEVTFEFACFVRPEHHPATRPARAPCEATSRPRPTRNLPEGTHMPYVLFGIAAYMVLSILLAVAQVGKPRQPTTGGSAVVTVVVGGAIAVAITIAGVTLLHR